MLPFPLWDSSIGHKKHSHKTVNSWSKIGQFFSTEKLIDMININPWMCIVHFHSIWYQTFFSNNFWNDQTLQWKSPFNLWVMDKQTSSIFYTTLFNSMVIKAFNICVVDQVYFLSQDKSVQKVWKQICMLLWLWCLPWHWHHNNMLKK